MPNTIPGERSFGAFVPEELIDSFRNNVRDEGFKLKVVVQRLMEFWLTLTPDQQRIFYAKQCPDPEQQVKILAFSAPTFSNRETLSSASFYPQCSVASSVTRDASPVMMNVAHRGRRFLI